MLNVDKIQNSLQRSTEVAFSVSMIKDARDYVLLGFANDGNLLDGLKGNDELVEFFKGYQCDLVIQPKINGHLNIVVKCDKMNEFVLIQNLKYDPVNLQLFISHRPTIKNIALVIGVNPALDLIGAMSNNRCLILSNYNVAWDI